MEISQNEGELFSTDNNVDRQTFMEAPSTYLYRTNETFDDDFVCYSSSSDDDHEFLQLDLKSELASWVANINITGVETDSLLALLSKLFPTTQLPKTYKF